MKMFIGAAVIGAFLLVSNVPHKKHYDQGMIISIGISPDYDEYTLAGKSAMKMNKAFENEITLLVETPSGAGRLMLHSPPPDWVKPQTRVMVGYTDGFFGIIIQQIWKF